MPKRTKIKGGGYLVVHARETRGLSQYELADRLAPRLGKDAKNIRDRIAGYEIDKVQVPVDFLDVLGVELGFEDDWYSRVQPPGAGVKSNSKPKPATILPDVLVLRAPSKRTHPLRSLFVLDRSQWRGRERLPGLFAQGLPQDEENQFPTLLSDVVEEGDETSLFIRKGDVFGVRTDLMPVAGVMALATGRKGEKLRRLVVSVEGHLKLRLPDDPSKDIPVADVASVEGVIIGRVRRGFALDEDNIPTNMTYRPKGLELEDL